MKCLSLVLFMLLSFEVTAHDIEKTCHIQLLSRGVFYYKCPQGMLADGAEAQHPNINWLPRTLVRCVEPILSCEEQPKDTLDLNNRVKDNIKTKLK